MFWYFLISWVIVGFISALLIMWIDKEPTVKVETFLGVIVFGYISFILAICYFISKTKDLDFRNPFYKRGK